MNQKVNALSLRIMQGLECENNPFLRPSAESDLALIASIGGAGMLVPVQAEVAVQHVRQEIIAQVINGAESDRKLLCRRRSGRS
jgi:hypothetical protein